MKRGRKRYRLAAALLCAASWACPVVEAQSASPNRPWGASDRPKRSDLPPRPEEALSSPFALSQLGDVQVTCGPGVRIYVEGRFRGQSVAEEGGLYVEGVPAGMRRLRAVKPGSRTQATEIEVLAGRTVEVVLEDFELDRREAEVGQREEVRIQRETGDVLLRSVPLRCTVTLLGRRYRKTRDILRLENIPAGTHSIEVERDGRVLRGELPVTPGKITWAQAHFRRGRIVLPIAAMLAHPGPGRRVTNSLGLTLTWIPGPVASTSPPDGPTAGFWMAEQEVNQGQYAQVMGTVPGGAREPSYPVDSVTYKEAREFCRRLTMRERGNDGLPPGWSYRLPSPQEWEAALAAGGEYPGSDVDLEDVAWLNTTSGGTPQPGGLKRPTPLGLHDLLGNLWEWCEPLESSRFPMESGGDRPLRGGSWLDPPSVFRDVPRLSFDGRRRHAAFGFRCVTAPPTHAWDTVHAPDWRTP